MWEFILERYNYWIVIILMMIGLYIVISRGNLVKTVIGLNVFQTSVFIFYITIGKIAGGTAPILVGGHGGGHDSGHGTGHGDDHGAPDNDLHADPHGDGLHHDAAAGQSLAEAQSVADHNEVHDTPESLGANTLSDALESDLHGDGAAESLHLVPEDIKEGASNSLYEDPGITSNNHGSPAKDENLHEVPEAATHSDPHGEPHEVDLHDSMDHAANALSSASEVIYTNPLPHVLILTAIVVGVATTAVGLALAVRIREAYGTIEEDELEAADFEAEFGRPLPGYTGPRYDLNGSEVN